MIPVMQIVTTRRCTVEAGEERSLPQGEGGWVQRGRAAPTRACRGDEVRRGAARKGGSDKGPAVVTRSGAVPQGRVALARC
jgi:hypothetical protein